MIGSIWFFWTKIGDVDDVPSMNDQRKSKIWKSKVRLMIGLGWLEDQLYLYILSALLGQFRRSSV